jgi:hypothetical protein
MTFNHVADILISISYRTTGRNPLVESHTADVTRLHSHHARDSSSYRKLLPWKRYTTTLFPLTLTLLHLHTQHPTSPNIPHTTTDNMFSLFLQFFLAALAFAAPIHDEIVTIQADAVRSPQMS